MPKARLLNLQEMLCLFPCLQIITDKSKRGDFHKIIRETFGGVFDTFTREVEEPKGASRISIKWGKHVPKPGGNNNNQSGDRKPRQERDRVPQVKLPPYIHFTLHKSNRDTQDCLGWIARTLHIKSNQLTTCGTKDKRGVTVQRVCFTRNRATSVVLWKAVNGLNDPRKKKEWAMGQRGERGLRIGDIKYSDEYLELGMLRGNHFTITLRNVKAKSPEHVDQIMTSLKNRGFINYYGMQRFGTASVPTHVIGLALLQSKWKEATDMLLMRRAGEHPECDAARVAWLEKRDVEEALRLMPRRNVAERCLWEFWQRDRTSENDQVGALMNVSGVEGFIIPSHCSLEDMN